VIRATAIAALLSVPASAAAGTAWLPPSAVAPATRGGGAPSVAGNDDGRAVAAWATRSGVVATLRTPGGPWYSPVRIPGSGRGARDVSAAMTDAGLAAVTWIEQGRVRASIRPDRRRFLPSVTLSSLGQVASSPRVAFGRGCSPVVAWAHAATDGGSSVHAACGRGGGRFRPAVALSAPAEVASTPAVAGSRAGTIVLWRQDEGGRYRVRSATRGPAGAFSPPDTVSPSGTAVVVDPSVALAPDGVAVAAWTLTQGSQVVAQAASRPVTGGWSRPDDLSRPADQVRGARVAVDGSGSAVATWTRAGVVQVSDRPSGGDWAPARDLSDAASTAGPPRLAVSGAGAAVVTWPAASGSTYSVQAALRPAGGRFTEPSTISDPGRPAIAPQAAIGNDGIAPVAWQWTDPSADPAIAPSGVMAVTGITGEDTAGTAIAVDLLARPARVRPGQAIRITFGLSSPSRVRLDARRIGSSRIQGAITFGGSSGANVIVLEGSIGGASLGRGRWVIRATPRGGVPRSLVLVVV
jgi:hypothetical protein